MDIIGIDWRQAWARYQESRRAADDAEYWNARAKSFSQNAGVSPYASEFLRRAGLREGESVLDMGCGSGTLALPMAQAGHEVWACDFSSAMLQITRERSRELGVEDLVHTVLLSWEDDWDSAGIPSCDVALASRSMAAADLWAAIEKLDGHARRRVCATMATGISPRIDETLARAIGRDTSQAPEYVYAMGTLWAMGKRPSLSFIETSRADVFDSRQEALDKHIGILQPSQRELELLEAYAAEHLAQREDGRWSFDHSRHVSWAFISWDK